MDDISPQQISNAMSSIAAALFQLFFHPFVLVTRVFFHREMGERYFTVMNAYFSLIAIAAATAASALASDKAGLAGGKAAIVIGVLWALAFLYCCGEHFRVAVPNRYMKGIKWHSRSDGIPRLPWLSYRIQYAIIFVAMVATGIFQLWGITILLCLSLWASLTSDHIAAVMFWNRVLDSIDGQINAEELDKAVKLRLTPAQACGIRASMPAYASAEFRARAAALLAASAGNRRNGPLPSASEAVPAKAPPPPAASSPAGQASPAPTVSSVSRKPFGVAGAEFRDTGESAKPAPKNVNVPKPTATVTGQPKLMSTDADVPAAVVEHATRQGIGGADLPERPGVQPGLEQQSVPADLPDDPAVLLEKATDLQRSSRQRIGYTKQLISITESLKENAVDANARQAHENMLSQLRQSLADAVDGEQRAAKIIAAIEEHKRQHA